MSEAIQNTRKTILTAEQTQQKLRRIAFEIYERNFEEEEIILAGVIGEGYEMAYYLQKYLKEISPIAARLIKITIEKHNPHLAPAQYNIDHATLNGKVIIVVDDVFNTGRTLAYSLSPLLGIHIKRVQVAVMVNRNHPSFPISADYIGYALNTTLNEHVQVVISGEQGGIFLS
jgi:pyrimidine operon attenuation protein / uracil phosphoribosyltransferase